MSEKFSEHTIRQASAFEKRHPEGVTENTQEVFEEEERQKAIADANPELQSETSPTPEEVEAKRRKENGEIWIKRIRESLEEKGAYSKKEIIDYEHPPTPSKSEGTE